MKRILMIMLSALFGTSVAIVFGTFGMIVLIIVGIGILVFLEWRFRQRERELKDILDRLDCLVVKSSETHSKTS